jgi:hypothetical protein
MKSKFFLCSIVLLSALNLFAQNSYKQPPQDVMNVLNAVTIPQTSVSPAKDKILLIESPGYPSIAELSQPMLRLAGLRINPNTNSAHRQPYAVKLTLKNIADGKECRLNCPPKRR